MNNFTEPQAILNACFDGLPWPALMVDGRGYVTFVNEAMRHARATPAAATGAPLADLFPEYYAALAGDAPWLTTQTVTACRVVHGATVKENLALHVLPFGACLFAISSPATAGGLGEIQLERLAALGFMVAGVCHELANPLTAINSTVQLLREQTACPPALLAKGLDNIAANVQRVLRISRKLNDFSRASDEARALLNLRGAMDDAVSLLRQDGLMQAVDVVCTLDGATVVHADAGQLQQVFCNVLTNAAQAMHGSGSVYIRDSHRDEKFIEIAIRDTGPGIAEHDLPRLFEPFFSTKPSGQGTGLGLAISNEIMLSHGGSLHAVNDAAGGACFYIRLPAVTA